jgi:hypothetical protein
MRRVGAADTGRKRRRVVRLKADTTGVRQCQREACVTAESEGRIAEAGCDLVAVQARHDRGLVGRVEVPGDGFARVREIVGAVSLAVPADGLSLVQRSPVTQPRRWSAFVWKR